MTKTLSNFPVWQCLAALLAVFMLPVPFAAYHQLADKGPSWLGLDVSWEMALNYAVIKHSVWGKDVLYTYGPLAWLSTRNGWGISRWSFLLFDSFIALNLYFVFADFYKRNNDKFLASAVLICLLLTVNQSFGTDLSFVLLFLIIWWMIKTFDAPAPASLGMLIVLSVLAFYVKANTGILAMLLLCLHFINLFISKKIKLVKLLVSLGSLVVLLIITAAVLHVAIISYITSSVEIIRGYNDIMYLDEGRSHLQLGIYVLSATMIIWFFVLLTRQATAKKYHTLLYPAACILYIFLMLKQATLRADSSHLSEFFSFCPLILMCGFTDTQFPKLHLRLPLVMIICSLFFVAENRTIDILLQSRFTGPADYFKQFKDYNSIPYLSQKNKRIIPQRVFDMIGSKTVDIYPWDSEYLIENKLNYSPRPAFQSHTAYTAALEKANFDFFIAHAPDFLIYDYDSIDDRYPFNDEPLVNLFILNNYTMVDSFVSNERKRIVLKRKSQVAPRFTDVRKAGFAMNEAISTDHVNFIKINIGYSVWGKITTMLHQPPHLQIRYMRADSTWYNYKASPELLRTGVYTGSLITSQDDFIAAITGKPLPPITQIRFNYDGAYFKKRGTVQAYYVKIPQVAGIKTDSLRVH